jgi:ABC-2 type transport system ATP-binding protein
MVEAKSLSMNYGTTRALVEASFVAADNQVMGLLGPNGAGKTTCMKIITTQMVPTSGTATVAGLDVLNSPIEVRRKVGYLPETAPLYNDMEVAEYLEFVGKGRGLQDSNLKNRIDWVVNATKIKEVYRRPIGELSRGFRQRVGLAQALIHDPEVLILDEPTSGLDPLQIVGIRQLIKDLSATKTIIFSTHILQEVEAISDRIVIINEGSIIADGTPAELRLTTADKASFTVEVKATKDAVESAFTSSGDSLELHFAGTNNDFSKFAINGADYDRTQTVISDILKNEGWQVMQFSPESPSLEDAFIELTREGRSHE